MKRLRTERHLRRLDRELYIQRDRGLDGPDQHHHLDLYLTHPPLRIRLDSAGHHVVVNGADYDSAVCGINGREPRHLLPFNCDQTRDLDQIEMLTRRRPLCNTLFPNEVDDDRVTGK